MRYISFLFLVFIFRGTADAQIVGPLVSSEIRQNGVSSIAATGDTVWISPALNRNIDNSPEWFKPTGIDSIELGEGRVFSLDVNVDTVFAGLGITSETIAGDQPAGYGYYLSIDGGDSWRFVDFLLDDPPPSKCIRGNEAYVQANSPEDYDPDCDITFEYGGETYNRIRIIVPEQSPAYNVAFRGNVLFSANWASGLLRSTDFGESWERVILPPFNVSDLNPENTYEWRSYFSFYNSDTGRNDTVRINRYDPVVDDNLKGFAVHIDSENRVWYGSAGGINISENALTAPIDSIRWRNVNFENNPEGLLARWIVEIREDTSSGRIWMTNWLAESTGSPYEGLDKQGLVYTEDGGQTFNQRLIGEKINSITFKEGVVFAAGESGLFISRDNGDTWVKSPQIRSANAILKEATAFRAAATTTDRVWIGTTDGVISTGDLGRTWEIYRVNFPLSGGNAYDPEARSVDTYAYPNPYSPTHHDIVRIRFDAGQSGNVSLKIFDFGMNLVRQVDEVTLTTSGAYEMIWDGLDGRGRKVANGPYFYSINTPDGTVNGKILLIE